ncbi:MAG: CRISPR-associated protein Csx19 [Roseiflexaceae bacterium]|nr:CRISPR-associated protein Csx19 [Roseiflexaceae bacterium]
MRKITKRVKSLSTRIDFEPKEAVEIDSNPREAIEADSNPQEAAKIDGNPQEAATGASNTKKDTGLRTWLTAQAVALVKNHKDKRCWLLAHCEDGVIWGELCSLGKLHLSCEAFPTLKLSLRWDTLQQARLFGEAGELLLWCGPQSWQARVLNEVPGGEADGYIDEEHLLWGYARDGETLARKDGFVQLSEGSQGIIHAPPLGDATPHEMQRASLKVRHYLGEDGAGVARITHSRLVRLCSGAK